MMRLATSARTVGFFVVLLLGLALLPPASNAAIGTIDNVPAATLLVPYFEVELGNPAGWTTLLSVNNASDAPALAHVTVWSEFSIPVLDFDLYMSGYDVQTINLYDILVNGRLPQTGSAAQPAGALSQANSNFVGCSDGSTPGLVPNYLPFPETLKLGVQQALSGQELSVGGFAPGLCAAYPERQNIMRGYVTIDSVTECSQSFPSSDGYFVDGGNGIADNRNVLWGDYVLCHIGNSAASGFPMVHIEADASLSVGAGACDPSDYEPTTFYCRYTAQFGADNREALPSEFGIRYLEGGPFTGGTDLYVYRDPNRAGFLVDCGDIPWPMTVQEIAVFDENENVLLREAEGGPSSPFGDEGEPLLLPFEANHIEVGEDLVTESDFGWLWIDLDGAVDDAESNQGWVSAVLSAEGVFSVGYEALQLNNLTLSP